MNHAPAFETRGEQAYVGKRVVMPMDKFDDIIPALVEEISKWLDDHGMKASGNSFLRYHVYRHAGSNGCRSCISS
jgi:hypothetical protein